MKKKKTEKEKKWEKQMKREKALLESWNPPPVKCHPDFELYCGLMGW